jgi:hypothetical protein
MIHPIAWTKLILDINGDRRVVQSLTLAKRRYFVELQTYLAKLIEEFPECTIGTLYDLEPDFAWAIGESLRLFGLSPNDFSAGQVNQLLFAYEGGPGALWQLEFPDRGEVKGRLLNPDVDPYHSAIAAAWSYTPDKSLSEIVESMDCLPWNDYSAILAERNRMTIEADPELRKKEQEREQREVLKKQLQEMDFQSFFDDFNPFTEAV